MFGERARHNLNLIFKGGHWRERTPNLHVHYCICGEFILVVDAPLASLPRRPADNSHALVNEGAAKRTYKLNVSQSNKSLVKPAAAATVTTDGGVAASGVGAAGKEGNGVLSLRDGKFEYQRRFYCTRCQLQIGYETVPGEGAKGVATFILPGALTDVQNKVSAEAFGEPAITPAGNPKGVEV
ncbi:hypothetical protein JCM11491_000873 [Sporobolomyces phaffii]